MKGISLEMIIAIGGFLCTLIALLANYFGVIGAIKEGLAKVTTTVRDANLPMLLQRITTVETLITSYGDVSNRLATLESRMELFWGMVEANMPNLLHHPITPEKDSLLENFKYLSEQQMCRLKELLVEEKLTVGRDTPDRMGKILAYSLMIARIDDKLTTLRKKCEETR